MRAIKTLGATLIAAGLLASVMPAAASARVFEGYIACSRSAQAPEARSCPRSHDFTVFFRSLDATVLFHLCVKFPHGRQCSGSFEAEQNHLYSQEIHPASPGRYRVTFFVDGNPIGSKAVEIAR